MSLKIEDKRKSDCLIYDIEEGGLFEYVGSIYIKSDERDDDGEIISICLDDGIVNRFNGGESVKPVNATLTIN